MINFPKNPVQGQKYSAGIKTWTFNGRAWELQSVSDSYVQRTETAMGTAQAAAATALKTLATESVDPPAAPIDGQEWTDAASGRRYTWNANSSCWAETYAALSVDNPALVDLLRADVAAAIGSVLMRWPNNGTPLTLNQALDTLYFGIANAANPLYAGGVKGAGGDDTAALQAAINDAIATKKRLFIPAGTFNVTKVLGFGSQYCLKINGPIAIEGAGQGLTTIRTTKLDRSLPDSSGIGYAGAIGIVTNQATPEISISNLTLEGANTSTAHTFNDRHKGIYCDQNAFPVQQFHLEFVTIQNFEGEGAYTPNYNITNSVVFSCHFENCGGSMGNLSGSTKYLNCRFVRGNNNGIEMSLDQYTGHLVVDGCSFYNACQSGGTSITCQGPSTNDTTKRTGTKLIVRNTTFEYTQAWLTATNAGPNYRVSPVSFTGVGMVSVQGNVFTNATVGIPNGHGILLIRNFNDSVDFANNVMKCNDAFFNCSISHGNMGNTMAIQLRGNTTLSEYPLAATQDLYQSGGNITGDKFTSCGNVLQMKTGIAFTAALTIVDAIVLPPYKTCKAKIVLNIVNSVASVIDFNMGAQNLINEVLPVGKYVRYVDVLVPATASYMQMQQYRIRCSGDAANSFSISLMEV